MSDETSEGGPQAHRDVQAKVEAKSWFYSETVKDHFFHPKNFLASEEEARKADAEYDGVGAVGSPACGDMMRVWIKVKDDRIVDCKWQTFGCASAIASTSMMSVMVSENGGMKIDDALAIKPQDITARLEGLPSRKFHCSVLGDKALRAAVNDYFKKSGQLERVKVEGAKIIDKILKVTDKDIEEAVLEGARTFEEVQKKTKVGIMDKGCVEEVEELIRFYSEKYFG